MAGNQGNVEFESNKLAFSGSSTSGKYPKSPKPDSEDSDIASSTDDSDAKVQTAVRGSGFAEYEETRGTLDENTVDEADDILNNFSEKSEETAEDIAAEAEDIMSGFSGSKSSSESSSSSSSSDPKEFAMGLGGSSNSSEDEEEVLMHAMSSDDDGDIGLDELFETAAALDVTLETENSAQNIQQELYEDGSPQSQESGADSMDVESNSSLSCSTIEEEHTESIEAEQTTNEEDPASSSDEEEEEDGDDESEKTEKAKKSKATAAAALASTAATTAALASVPLSAPRSFQPAVQKAASAVYSNNRTLLYDTDDEEAGNSEEASPMPWFSAMPYSTGKWKKTEDGMSVVSDDISYGGRGAPVLKANHHLPYTPGNRNYAEPPPPRGLQRKHWILIIIGLLLLLVAAILLGIYLSAADPAPPTIVIKEDTNAAGTQSPTFVDTLNDFFTETTITPTTITTIEEESVNQDVATDPPTLVTTVVTTVQEIPEMVVNFESTSVLTGEVGGEEFGSVVSMTRDGNYMATLSNSDINPVQAFVKSGGLWLPLPEIPFADLVKYGDGYGDGSSVATALTQDGKLVVAFSHFSQVEVYLYTDGMWVPKGEVLEWDTPRGKSRISMDMNTNGSVLALGLVDAMGTTIGVSVYVFDDYLQSWGIPTAVDPMAHRDGMQRSVRPEEGTILSMSVRLSGDGNVMSIAEWDVGSPQVIVQSFEKNYYAEWSPMGEPMQFPYGPVSMALSGYGNTLAVVAENPGMGSVYRWDGKKWSILGSNAVGGFLPGGSDVALSREGFRIIIGNAEANTVSVYDLTDEYNYYFNSEEWSAWMPVEALFGPEDSGFGASVAMDVVGNVLGIGAPSSGFNVGSVTFYGQSA